MLSNIVYHFSDGYTNYMVRQQIFLVETIVLNFEIFSELLARFYCMPSEVILVTDITDSLNSKSFVRHSDYFLGKKT